MPEGATPAVLECRATPEEKWIKWYKSRAVSIQNTGTNTLWLSIDRENWFYVAAGTSCSGPLVLLEGLWCCTQTGETTWAVSRIPW